MYRWSNFDILSPEDRDDLERYSAVFEFKHAMPRAMAENEAYKKYKRIQHAKGAGYHLAGMSHMHELGDFKAAQQHYTMYSLHLAQLGLNPNLAVAPEVIAFRPEDFENKIFESYPSDQFLSVP